MNRRGPYKARDKIGKTFGHVTAFAIAEEKRGSTYQWICFCGLCGLIFVAPTLDARRVSCGCARRRGRSWGKSLSRKGYGEEHFFKVARSYADRRGYEWAITYEQWQRAMEQPCFYCGGKTTGLDRIHNDIGYEPGNVVPCCKICNHAKSNMPLEMWDEWRSRIASNA